VLSLGAAKPRLLNSVAVARSGTIYATERAFPRVRAIDPATGDVRTAVGGP
jgi:hypothetical protein